MYSKLNTMDILLSTEELPMKCFRMTFSDDIYDIFTPSTDVSDVVCIMRNGEFLPFNEWDEILVCFQP